VVDGLRIPWHQRDGALRKLCLPFLVEMYVSKHIHVVCCQNMKNKLSLESNKLG
jgi:hypothetical protein